MCRSITDQNDRFGVLEGCNEAIDGDDAVGNYKKQRAQCSKRAGAIAMYLTSHARLNGHRSERIYVDQHVNTKRHRHAGPEPPKHDTNDACVQRIGQNPSDPLLRARAQGQQVKTVYRKVPLSDLTSFGN